MGMLQATKSATKSLSYLVNYVQVSWEDLKGSTLNLMAILIAPKPRVLAQQGTSDSWLCSLVPSHRLYHSQDVCNGPYSSPCRVSSGA